MRLSNNREVQEHKVCEHAWAWVEDTCRAIVALETGKDEPDLVLKAYDEVSAMIEASGMTGPALVEQTIRWAYARIEKPADRKRP